MSYLEHLEDVAKADVESLIRSEKHYGDSWKKRGGVGAFMMMARKWDRMENALAPGDGKWEGPTSGATFNARGVHCPPWDIFGAIAADERAEGIIDDLRDLRRYLMLVEAEMRVRGVVRDEVKKD